MLLNKIAIYFFGIILFSSLVVGLCDSGCVYNEVCYMYGDENSIGPNVFYCDINGTFVQKKTSDADCVNDFECAEGYSCLGDSCTNLYEDYIFAWNLQSTGISDIMTFCMGDDLFCYNLSMPANSQNVTSKTCSFKNDGSSCYRCNTGYYWNDSLKKCITGICDKEPGCLSNNSILNGTKLDLYCSSGSCFECDSDFEWNDSSDKCVLKACSSLPGCKSVTEIANAKKLNRQCGSGSCFICVTGYKWDNVSLSCVRSYLPSDPNMGWNNVPFTNYNFEVGTPVSLKDSERIYFDLDGRTYWLGVKGIYSNQRVNLMIDPTINDINLYAGSSVEYDLNGNGGADVTIKLNKIENDVAEIVLQKKTLSSTVTNTPSNQDVIAVEDSEIKEKVDPLIVIWFFVILAIILLILIILVIVYYSKNNKINQESSVKGTVTYPNQNTNQGANNNYRTN